MHPQDMPKKHASRTTLVKNCRKITLAANQRMHANSKNRTRNPVRKRLRPCVRASLCAGMATFARELVTVLSTTTGFSLPLSTHKAQLIGGAPGPPLHAQETVKWLNSCERVITQTGLATENYAGSRGNFDRIPSLIYRIHTAQDADGNAKSLPGCCWCTKCP